MSKFGPKAEELLPFVQQSNDDYPCFDVQLLLPIAEFAVTVVAVKGPRAYKEAWPEIISGIRPEFSAEPLSALETIIQRANFLWRCARDIKAISPRSNGYRSFPAFEVQFCASCPPARAGRTFIVASEEVEHHPLLDCTLPRCKGFTSVVTAYRLKQENLTIEKLPPAQ